MLKDVKGSKDAGASAQKSAPNATYQAPPSGPSQPNPRQPATGGFVPTPGDQAAFDAAAKSENPNTQSHHHANSNTGKAEGSSKPARERSPEGDKESNRQA